MQFNIETNFPEVAKAMKQLGEDVARKATASALNKTVAQAKTAMSREIRAEFNINKSKVDKRLEITNARLRGGQLTIEASLFSRDKFDNERSFNLINFMERSVSFAQARKRGKLGTLNRLHVQIKKAGGKKALGSAFIGNKGRTVFVRVPGSTMASRSKYAGTKHSEKIAPMQTIHVARMFNTKRINAKVLAMIEAKFPELFANEAKFFTDRFNRTGKA